MSIEAKNSENFVNEANSREVTSENKFESNFSTFSFSNKVLNEPKVETVYKGTGYSNNLIKYEPLSNLNIEGKYVDAFNMIINPKPN